MLSCFHSHITIYYYVLVNVRCFCLRVLFAQVSLASAARYQQRQRGYQNHKADKIVCKASHLNDSEPAT